MTITVYKITNTVTNKTYIGQTTNYQKRKTQHFSQLRCNRHPNEHLQRSFNKYGEDNFTMDIIKKCHINELDNWERWYISVNQSNNPKYGYNLESGGNLNKTHSEETKQKMNVPEEQRT